MGNLSDDEWADRAYPVAEDMSFQRRTWVAERIGWFLIIVLILLALAGVFSSGPLSSTTAQDGSGRLTVQYDRFGRYNAAARLVLKITPLQNGPVVVRVDADFLDAFTIEWLHPMPAAVRSFDGGSEWTFHAGTTVPFSVYISLRPDVIGLRRARIALDDETDTGTPAHLLFFVYP